MVDNVTAHILNVLAAKKKTSQTIVDPRRVAIALPNSRVPKADSVVSFKYLLMNSIKYQPDEANSEHVTLRSLAKKNFKNGSIGAVGSTLTDLPQYRQKHKWDQTLRCTPASYRGKIIDCPSIVFNCSCPRFTFVWNWVLWAKSASVLNATNEPPDITNPRKLIGGCKHAIIFLQAIKKRGM
jgi:hypothetical protein